ncbi:hypothetical protein UG55_100228 [Frankia sp. EI5c]|uniref:hypothetical protein n=1 Tax=Frankia sp. EI5c TaxID=683316 RepID=UPI0007C2D53A|nr:hypothetical protein [Frankia sp. EI5c]OAA29397.1 hypothetical protein UG55_100228 [Frankia sp. EI5c]
MTVPDRERRPGAVRSVWARGRSVWVRPGHLPAAVAAGVLVGAATLGAGWPFLRHSPTLAVVNIVVAGGLTAAGVLGISSAPLRRCGVALAGSGLAWLATWVMSWNAGPAPLVGIIGNCVFYILFGLALLGYPDGRLSGRADRLVIALAVLDLGPLMAASVLTSKADWNGYAPDAWWPGWQADRSVFEAISSAYQVINPLLGCAFAVLLIRRVRQLRGPERAAAPLVLGAVAVALVAVALLAPPISVADLDGVLRGLAAQSVIVAVFPVVLVIAAGRRALGVLTAADRVLRLADPATVRSVRDALRTVLGDPGVEVFFWLPDLAGYVDVDGRPVDLAAAARPPARWTREVRTRDGSRLAVVTGDPALEQYGAFTHAALRAGRLALENAQLQVAVRARLVEAHGAHRREAGARAAQRLRMARDLEDGMRRRLMDLVLVAARAEAGDPAQARVVLRQLHDGLLAANKEVRDLGRDLERGLRAEATPGIAPAGPDWAAAPETAPETAGGT